MTHQEAMKATSRTSTCTGEIITRHQGFYWVLGTCPCGTQIVLRGGTAHKDNYIVAEVEPRKEYQQTAPGQSSAYENHIQMKRQVGHDGITSVTFDDLVASQQTAPEMEMKR